MTENNKPKIGLALGSGGILGLAHIGVIKVLLKNNIPIDCISGSSIGALVGAYLAIHGEVDSLEKLILEDSKDYLPIFFDFSFSGGLVDGKKINNFLKKRLGDVEFSETKIPFFIVATDIMKRESVVFSSGKIIPAIRGSISIPVVFKPFSYQDKLLIDGGLSNPVPVDVLKNNGTEKVIAVNLYNQCEITNKKFAMTTVAMDSAKIILNNLAKMSSKNADVLLNPDAYTCADKMKITDYFKPKYVKELISIGEDEALRHLDEIKALVTQTSANINL